MMTIENSLMETPTDPTGRIASLCEVMNDLARSADTQGARAAAADDVDASSELFGLAALLRTEAANLESGESTVDHGQEILDGAQRLVVQQMLRIDRLQQNPSPFVIGRPGRGALALNRRLELLGRDERACLGGCWWLDDQDDICSSCAPSAGAVVDARARFAHREGSERSDGAEGAGGQQDEGD